MLLSKVKMSNGEKINIAGKQMTQAVPVTKQDDTIAEVEQLLLKHTNELETVNYIYVTDEGSRLVGVLSVKEIFRASKNLVVRDLMKTNLVTVRFGTHQEKVANLALKHNLKAVPVLDKDDRFLGVVPSDAILKIFHKEHEEDIMHSAGVVISKNQEQDIISTSAFLYFEKRIPWLVFGLVGGVGAAFMVGVFDEALKKILTLAAFIPAIVYMADAVGVQTQTIFIRSIAIDHEMGVKKYVIREMIVGTVIALLLGFLIGVVSFIWWKPAILGLILGISFFLTIMSAIMVALFLPWFFLRATNIDPAIASGPFATIIRDMLSLIIYFGVASLMIKIFGV